MKDMSVVNAPRRWIDGYDSFAVWGIASSGVAAANLLARHGKRVCISDPRSREVLSTHLEQLHEDVEVHCGANTFGDAQVVVTSPGLPPRLALFQEAADKSIPVISEIELAFDAAVAPFVCITGTDGKTTTTSLIGAILDRAGLEHVVAGNIGIPLCDVVEDISADGFIVAEVSAFQLWTTHHFHPLMACFTNLAGDHLDYFEGDFEAYGHAKKMLIQNMDPAHDRLWVNGEDHTSAIWSEQFGKRAGVFVLGRERLLDALTDHVGPLSIIDEGKMLYLPEGVSASSADGIVLVEDISTLSLHGRHNQKNMLCAASMCFVCRALSCSSGVTHRQLMAPCGSCDAANSSNWVFLSTTALLTVRFVGKLRNIFPFLVKEYNDIEIFKIKVCNLMSSKYEGSLLNDIPTEGK